MILDVITLGDPRLKQVSQPVVVDDEIRRLVENMIDTMYSRNGIGLAAVQVGELKRLFVIDIEEITDEPIAFINPTITHKSTERETESEGCLSIPGFTCNVCRPEKIEIEYQNTKGEKQQLSCDGLLARCIQHEFEHLDGRLILDHQTNKNHWKEYNSQLNELDLPSYYDL